MCKYILLLLLMVAPLTGMADIYRSVDSNGDVVFSDHPSPNATKIPTPKPNTIQLPKAPPPTAKKEKKKIKSTVYSSFTIVSPAANETIRSNPGVLNIQLKLTPKLNVKAGDRVSILVDNEVLLRGITRLSIKIPDINRGSHHVQAVVTSKGGDILIKSDDVQFFMKRHSVLLKPKAHATPGPMGLGPAGGIIKPGPQDASFKPGPQGTWFKPGPEPVSKENP